MLVLSRKLNQEIVIGDNIRIRVLKIKGNTIRLGIDAPRDVKVIRAELPVDTEFSQPEPVPAVEDEVEVTVVFSNDDESQKPTVDLIPFCNEEVNQGSQAKQKTRNRKHSGGISLTNMNASMVDDQPKTVRFKQHLPKSLQHNRLKELVRELTDDN